MSFIKDTETNVFQMRMDLNRKLATVLDGTATDDIGNTRVQWLIQGVD